MAKHPVPKYKTPKAKTRTRHSAFKRKTVTKLEGIVNARIHKFKNATKLVDEKKKQREVAKITKVKA